MSQFRATRNLYMEYVHDFEFPLTYEAWLNADDEYKAVLLFVNFFNEIELAWYKERYSYGPALEEDAVSEVNQYLIKNVPIIKENPKRFSPGYIYRVAANCISCVGASQVSINTYKLETSNEVAGSDGSVINLFDTEPFEDDSYESRQAKEAVWDIIERMGPKAQKVVNKLINPTDSLAVTRNKDIGDKLQDVSVSKKEFAEIVEQLREVLKPFLEDFMPEAVEVTNAKRNEVVSKIAQIENALETIDDEATKKRCRKALKLLKAELAEYDMYHAKCVSKRDQFIAEINKLEAALSNVESDKEKHSYLKAIKNMRAELTLYDMLQTGYSV